ncbi:MAG: hypothetical protein K2P68_05995 [Sphingomonas sp.]|nr:hypothetical protein [Sphingomonas sp.]
MMIRPITTAPLLALALAGCSSGGTNAADTMPMNSAGAMMDMPKPDGRSFDVKALPMYPGATMIDMKIMAHTTPDAMAYSFAAPAPLATVHDWFKDALPKAGLAVTEQGEDFTGTDKDGKMFRLDLARAAGDTTTGTITSGN